MNTLEAPKRINRTYSDSLYEKEQEKNQFFKKISEQYSQHARLLVSFKHFKHMKNELQRFNDFYKEILETIDNKDCDISYYQAKFNNMIDDDKEVMKSL